MKIYKRLNSYPILMDDDDDYIDSYFDFELEHRETGNQIIFKCKFILKNDELKKLINDNLAKFIVHLECSTTSYRKVFSTSQEHIEFLIDASSIAQKLQASSFIVATQNIVAFKSEKFNKKFNSQSFEIEKGNYLAIGSYYDIDISRDGKNNNKLEDIFVIRQQNDLKGNVAISIEGNTIVIFVDENVKNKYFSVGEKSFRYTVISSIFFPSMIYILYNMKNNEELREYRWYTVVEKSLNSRGINVQDLDDVSTIGKNSIYKLAQEIFKFPIEKAMKELTVDRGGDLDE